MSYDNCEDSSHFQPIEICDLPAKIAGSEKRNSLTKGSAKISFRLRAPDIVLRISSDRSA